MYVAKYSDSIDWQESLQEEDDIVRLTDSGRLQPGFQEYRDELAGSPLVAWLRRDPFDSPKLKPPPAHVKRLQIVRTKRQKPEHIVTLSALEELVDGCDDPLVFKGVDLLSALAAE